MASFDIIESAGYGYQLAWQERRYLGRLATVPLFVKFCCLLTITLAGLDNRFLAQGMILLPSFFADGWMLSHYIRLIFLDQRWPFRPSGDSAADRQEAQARASGLMAGSLVFAVTCYLMSGLSAWRNYLADLINAGAEQHPPVMPSPGLTLAFVATMVFIFWSFRFVWFFIPATLEYDLRQCMARLRGFATSFYILAVVIICSLPAIAVKYLITGIIGAPYDLMHPETLPLTVNVFLSMLRTVVDTVMDFISTGALAYAWFEMMSDRQGSANDQKKTR